MHAFLTEARPGADDIRVAFRRAARLALAGLLAAPALLGLASAARLPLPGAVDAVIWASALAGFGGAGWAAGRSLGVGPRREAALAGVFLVVGVIVTPVFRQLQGLTGRESMIVVLAAALAPFAAAFVLAGVLAARVLGVARLRPRGVLVCMTGGLLGGLFALLPFCWAWLRVEAAGKAYVMMAIAVVGFLGCLIAPFHVVGLALDDARRRT